ncbi:hypothetical protein Dsin_022628 [Dipteronia sinensis]|uniref:Reverse transcriptase n=1 Tax=Dipteronia sinensis TaxID=43782 RepID=A0AAE0A1R3_9ROSI|nr:hypothetical protein Dsin_022628 [Dipteronia sinensis]
MDVEDHFFANRNPTFFRHQLSKAIPHVSKSAKNMSRTDLNIFGQTVLDNVSNSARDPERSRSRHPKNRKQQSGTENGNQQAGTENGDQITTNQDKVASSILPANEDDTSIVVNQEEEVNCDGNNELIRQDRDGRTPVTVMDNRLNLVEDQEVEFAQIQNQSDFIFPFQDADILEVNCNKIGGNDTVLDANDSPRILLENGNQGEQSGNSNNKDTPIISVGSSQDVPASSHADPCNSITCTCILEQEIQQVLKDEPFIPFVYAATTVTARRHLWDDMLSLSSSVSGPWLDIGDFNAVIGAYKKSGGVIPSAVSCKEFQSMSDSCNLIHMPTSGSLFTWTNCSASPFRIEMHLDRSHYNLSWLDVWPSSYCLTLPRTVSDHNPLIFNGLQHSSYGSKPFRFHNMWFEHGHFKDIVTSSWLSSPSCICPMKSLITKLKYLKGYLKSWNFSIFGDVHLKDAMSTYIVNYFEQLYSSEASVNQHMDILSHIPHLVTDNDNENL